MHHVFHAPSLYETVICLPTLSENSNTAPLMHDPMGTQEDEDDITQLRRNTFLYDL